MLLKSGFNQVDLSSIRYMLPQQFDQIPRCAPLPHPLYPYVTRHEDRPMKRQSNLAFNREFPALSGLSGIPRDLPAFIQRDSDNPF